MNKKIYVIRTAPYDYLFKDMNLYQSFNAVAKGETEVTLKSNSLETIRLNVPNDIFKAQSLYCSPRSSVYQTAKLLTSNPIILPELVEIRYQMEDFILENEFYNNDEPNVNLARERFVEGLVDNKLQEDYQHIFKRLDQILKKVRNDPSQIIVIITHGFLMKLIESYIKNPLIAKNPIQLKSYFNGKSETFKFCEGFVVNLTNNRFTFKSYIRNRDHRQKSE